MPQASLNLKTFSFDNAKDSIVIVNALGDLPGGRTLDVSAYTGDVIYAGHVIGKKTVDGAEVYFPLKVSSGSFAELGSGESAVGILKASIAKEMPIAAIVTVGQINEAAMPAKLSATLKSALSHIQFI